MQDSITALKAEIIELRSGSSGVDHDGARAVQQMQDCIAALRAEIVELRSGLVQTSRKRTRNILVSMKTVVVTDLELHIVVSGPMLFAATEADPREEDIKH